MKKKYILATVLVLAMGMGACSLEPIEEQPNSGAIAGLQMANDDNAGAETKKTEDETKNTEAETQKTEGEAEKTGVESKETEKESGKPETESAKTESMKTEDEKVETPLTENAGNDADSQQSVSIVVSVESFEDDVIAVKDQSTGNIFYFSTKEAEVIEGDVPISTGDIVEIICNEAQGDKEHPGTAIKVIELSMRQCTITASVESLENGIIAVRDIDSDMLLYFSIQEAEVIEGDAPITIGDIVELTYRGVQGDEEHPGIAVKVVAEAKGGIYF